jgi:putative spermidine/putrescine transport system ATP-binding protein
MSVQDQRFTELRLDGIGRDFGTTAALRDLSLTIRGGEFIALLGPSGCGKSTALNCLAGLLPLTTGSIWLDGKRIDGLPPEQRGFGMVFQNYALFPHMTVRDNVAFGLKMRKIPKTKLTSMVDEVMHFVRLEDHAGKLPSQLSGGQQQRVAIARAIVYEPPLVLMDEPLSNLDAQLRLAMRTEIRHLHQTLHLTTVYVTHDQEEALSMADRLVVLREGVVQQVGTPDEVYGDPANRYVAGFMGYRNMLALDVEPRVSGKQIVVSGPGIKLTGRAFGDIKTARAIAAVRPEDFIVDGPPPNRIHVVAEVVEYHGREMLVEARLPDGHALFFRTEKRLAPGDSATVSVPPERVLIYPSDEPAAPVEALP